MPANPSGARPAPCPRPAPGRPAPRPASLLGAFLVGLVIAAMGGFFSVLLWRGYETARAMDDWVKTPARVLVSEVETYRPTPNSPEAHRLNLEYAYTFDGVSRTSSRHRRVDGPSSHRRRIEAIVRTFPAGSEVVCFVNPVNPEMAVLKRASKAPLYSIWFPGLFVVGGLGIVVGVLRALLRRRRAG